MPIEKKVCAYCGKNGFGLVRHFVGFHHLCTRAFSDRNESVGIPKTARVRFKLDAGEGGQHA